MGPADKKAKHQYKARRFRIVYNFNKLNSTSVLQANATFVIIWNYTTKIRRIRDENYVVEKIFLKFFFHKN